MLSIIRRIFKKREETSPEPEIIPSAPPLIHHVDESEVCVVSVESLRCSICYSIYAGTPLMLQCGHSFCAACFLRVTQNQNNQPARNQRNQTIPCPMCRKRVDPRKSAKNYVLKSILDSVNEISEDQETSRQAYANTMEVTNEVLRQQRDELENSNKMLKIELQKCRRDAFIIHVLIIIVTVLVFVFLKFC